MALMPHTFCKCNDRMPDRSNASISSDWLRARCCSCCCSCSCFCRTDCDEPRRHLLNSDVITATTTTRSTTKLCELSLVQVRMSTIVRECHRRCSQHPEFQTHRLRFGSGRKGFVEPAENAKTHCQHKSSRTALSLFATATLRSEIQTECRR